MLNLVGDSIVCENKKRNGAKPYSVSLVKHKRRKIGMKLEQCGSLLCFVDIELKVSFTLTVAHVVPLQPRCSHLHQNIFNCYFQQQIILFGHGIVGKVYSLNRKLKQKNHFIAMFHVRQFNLSLFSDATRQDVWHKNSV